MRITKVADGAFFVPSYSVQTITTFQPNLTNQTIVSVQNDNTQPVLFVTEPIEEIEVEPVGDPLILPLAQVEGQPLANNA